MNIQTAKKKLDQARADARELRKQIEELRTFLMENGEDPDAPKIDLTDRNKEIYLEWLKGGSYTEIARSRNLSSTTIYNVCQRIDRTLEKKGGNFYARYKDLQRYRKKYMDRG